MGARRRLSPSSPSTIADARRAGAWATAVGTASVVFGPVTGVFTTTVHGFTQVKTIVRQPFGLAAPANGSIGSRLLALRGVWVAFDRRGWASGYHNGDMIRGFHAPDTELIRQVGAASASTTVSDEVALQMDRMRAMGINAISLDLRASALRDDLGHDGIRLRDEVRGALQRLLLGLGGIDDRNHDRRSFLLDADPSRVRQPSRHVLRQRRGILHSP